MKWYSQGAQSPEKHAVRYRYVQYLTWSIGVLSVYVLDVFGMDWHANTSLARELW